jgi:hypothetical protein
MRAVFLVIVILALVDFVLFTIAKRRFDRTR